MKTNSSRNQLVNGLVNFAVTMLICSLLQFAFVAKSYAKNSRYYLKSELKTIRKNDSAIELQFDGDYDNLRWNIDVSQSNSAACILMKNVTDQLGFGGKQSTVVPHSEIELTHPWWWAQPSKAVVGKTNRLLVLFDKNERCVISIGIEQLPNVEFQKIVDEPANQINRN